MTNQQAAAASVVSAGEDSALMPIAPEARQLRTRDLAGLWFGAAIAITEIWGGGLPGLTALGLGLGLVAIILGRCIGNGLMAAIAQVGAQTGLPGMVLARPALGVRGSQILASFNLLQLVGWTGWMLFVGASYCDILAVPLGLPTVEQLPAMRIVWVGLLMALCVLWSAGGERFWKAVQTACTWLLALLCVAMTFIVLRQYDAAALLATGTASPLGLLAGADLVVAMSVSWVPLVADYSRYAHTPRAGSMGTFWGYFAGGTWMYATGLLVALAAATSEPDRMVVQVMGSAGMAWAWLAVGLVLLSTVTTTFLDIFSAVVSAQNLLPRVPLRWGSVVVGLLGALCALGLDVYGYAPFLLAIGLVFLPAFSIVAVDYFIVRRQPSDYLGLAGTLQPALWNRAGLLAWLIGSVVFDRAQGWAGLNTLTSLFGTSIATGPWNSGASLPCLAASAVAYLALLRLLPARGQSLNSV
jgi:NCS1 family nucleobase:cation symporter-1